MGDCNAKLESQEIPGVTSKFGLGAQNETGQKLTEFCKENTLVIVNTLFQQYKSRLYTWTWPNGQYQNQTDYILFSQRRRGSIQSAKTRPEADCGSDHELLIAKFRLKLKKAGEITRPFRYDLNQITYDYTVGEGNGNPLQCSCLENPMDQGAWWATIHGDAKSRTRLSNFCVCMIIQ